MFSNLKYVVMLMLLVSVVSYVFVVFVLVFDLGSNVFGGLWSLEIECFECFFESCNFV